MKELTKVIEEAGFVVRGTENREFAPTDRILVEPVLYDLDGVDVLLEGFYNDGKSILLDFQFPGHSQALEFNISELLSLKELSRNVSYESWVAEKENKYHKSLVGSEQ